MKKLFSMFLSLLILALMLASCAPAANAFVSDSAPYSITLPAGVTASASGDGGAVFTKNGKVAGGVAIHSLPSDFSMNIAMFFEEAASPNGMGGYTARDTYDFSPLYPSGVIDAQVTKNEYLCPEYETALTLESGRSENHGYFIPSTYSVYDIWFDASLVSVEEAKLCMSSFTFGTDKTLSPDKTKFVTLHSIAETDEAYAYILEKGEKDGDAYYLREKLPAGGLMPNSAPSKPIWSNDGARLVISVENDSLKSFTFLLGGRPAEFQARRDILAAFKSSGYDFDYTLAENPDAEFVPIEFSDDGELLRFTYAFTTASNERISGTASYSVSGISPVISGLAAD